MTILYKYMTKENALRYLQSEKLLASLPRRFNDPFDSLPAAAAVADYEREASIQKLAKELESDHGDQAFKLARHKFGLLDKDARADIDHVRAAFYGVICFSRTNSQPLMWSHYAENHSGVVLAFDSDSSLFPRGDLLNVDYSATRPQYVIGDRDYLSIYKSKAIEWEYEREVRLLIPLADMKTSNLVVESEAMADRYFVSFPKKCLKKITLGAACSLTGEDVELIHGQSDFGVKLSKMHLHDSKYEIIEVVRARGI